MLTFKTFLFLLIFFFQFIYNLYSSEISVELKPETDLNNSVFTFNKMFHGLGLKDGLPDHINPARFNLKNPMHISLNVSDTLHSINIIYGFSENGDSVIYTYKLFADSLYDLKTIKFKDEFYVHFLDKVKGKNVVTNFDITFRLNPVTKMIMYNSFALCKGNMIINGKSYLIGLMREGINSFGVNSSTYIYIDRNNDGHLRKRTKLDSTGNLIIREAVSAINPVFIDGHVYKISKISANGYSLVLSDTTISSSMSLGFKIPDFSFYTIDNKLLSIKDFKNKILVINWWATTCSPCIMEIPGFNKLVNKYKNNKDIIFIAIADDNIADLNKFLKSRPYKYQIALSNEIIKKLMGSSWPRNIIVNCKGEIIYDETGGNSEIYKYIDASIKSLIK